MERAEKRTLYESVNRKFWFGCDLYPRKSVTRPDKFGLSNCGNLVGVLGPEMLASKHNCGFPAPTKTVCLVFLSKFPIFLTQKTQKVGLMYFCPQKNAGLRGLLTVSALNSCMVPGSCRFAPKAAYQRGSSSPNRDEAISINTQPAPHASRQHSFFPASLFIVLQNLQLKENLPKTSGFQVAPFLSAILCASQPLSFS